MHTVFSACVFSLCVSAVALCLLVPTGKRMGLIDYPDARKRHTFATPAVGGLAVFAGILAGWLWLVTFNQFDDVVLETACGLAVLGIIDDRYGLRVNIRVVAQIIAILIVILSSGVYVHSLGVLGDHELTLGWLGIPFTVLAVIGLINAFNLMDGIDGLTGCLTLVAAGAIVLLSFHHLAGGAIPLVLLLAAALCPYLVSNLGLFGRNCKVFLGDSGSVVLGYLLAWVLIQLSQSTPREMSPGLVLWCVALPIFDTLTVMFRRMYLGRSPFTPDRSHIHHLLMNIGLGPRATLVCLVAFATVLPFVGIAAHQFGGPVVNLLAFAIVLALYAAVSGRLWRRMPQKGSHASTLPLAHRSTPSGSLEAVRCVTPAGGYRTVASRTESSNSE